MPRAEQVQSSGNAFDSYTGDSCIASRRGHNPELVAVRRGSLKVLRPRARLLTLANPMCGFLEGRWQVPPLNVDPRGR
jgi:hypothetical protein